MFPARAAAQEKKGQPGQKVELVNIPKYEKVKGTEIKILKGGIAVRVASKSGKQFEPEDVGGAQNHVTQIKGENAKSDNSKKMQQQQGKGQGGGDQQWAQMMAWMMGKGKGKGKGGAQGNQQPKKVKKAPPVKKELTPEQIAAKQAKNAAAAAKKLAAEERVLDGNKFYKGDVVGSGGTSAWVKPQNASQIPSKLQPKLKQMNADLRAKATEKDAKKTKQKDFLEANKDDLLIYVRASDVAEAGLELKVGTTVQFKLYSDNKGVGGSEVKSA